MITLQISFRPDLVDPSAFIASSATVIGDVQIGAEASIWFGAVVRGDTDQIVIGPRTNVQDGCILHVNRGQPCRVGAGVTMGHGAIVHAATIEADCLIGMRATVLDDAVVGEGSIVAAEAVVPPGTVIPPRSLVMGVPAKVVRSLSEAEVERNRRSAERYVGYSREYLQAYKRSGLTRSAKNDPTA
jgi:carbonic anhydrase/acetyltransferase-like protein (isoleucine patch superfamily)